MNKTIYDSGPRYVAFDTDRNRAVPAGHMQLTEVRVKKYLMPVAPTTEFKLADPQETKEWRDVAASLVGSSLNGLQLRHEFIKEMGHQLGLNEHRGRWEEYKPDAGRVREQVSMAVNDLLDEMASGSPEQVAKKAADVANIAMKIHECFGPTAAG